LKWADWRPGDQRAFVSDIRKLERTLEWAPQVDVAKGVDDLLAWIIRSRDAIAALQAIPSSPLRRDESLSTLQPLQVASSL
jgi:dTDP-D-glucose 4,6-dehydratase